jgi:hypothetical protein
MGKELRVLRFFVIDFPQELLADDRNPGRRLSNDPAAFSPIERGK